MLDVQPIRRLAERAGENIGRVIVGKRDVVDLLWWPCCARGHVLATQNPIELEHLAANTHEADARVCGRALRRSGAVVGRN